jgi:hypothetical protein
MTDIYIANIVHYGYSKDEIHSIIVGGYKREEECLIPIFNQLIEQGFIYDDEEDEDEDENEDSSPDEQEDEDKYEKYRKQLKTNKDLDNLCKSIGNSYYKEGWYYQINKIRVA